MLSNVSKSKEIAQVKRVFLLICLILSLSVLAACGSNDGEMKVEMVKANLTLPTETGAVYMTISNETGEDDVLTAASVPGCATVELHEMLMENDIMNMRQVEGGEIPIPAGETVELKQGGLHVMCIGKTGEFAVGDSVEVTLEFDKAGTIEVTAEIIAPGGIGMNQ
jgi:copper(I)-binding protein